MTTPDDNTIWFCDEILHESGTELSPCKKCDYKYGVKTSHVKIKGGDVDRNATWDYRFDDFKCRITNRYVYLTYEGEEM